MFTYAGRPRAFTSRLALSAAILVFGAVLPLKADSVSDCLGNDMERRIEACTAILAIPNLPPHDMGLAYSMRALAYSIKHQYDLALPDFDMAIKHDPSSSIAFNNRAWTLLKTGAPEKGLSDVERALALSPASPHSYDTRAHILQALGHPAKAIADYEKAMLYGGRRMVKMYQCGLRAAGLFTGEADGFFTMEVGRALNACVKRSDCDPLPPDEDCRSTTS